MSAIEHGKIHQYATEQSTFKHSQKEAPGYQAAERFCETNTSTHDTPCCDESGQKDAGFDSLDDPVSGHINQNVRNKKDENGDVKFCARLDVEVLGEAVDFGVSNVASVDKRK